MSQDTKKVVGPSELLAAAAAIAAGTQAYGEVVIFINPEPGEPGHFDWLVGDEFDARTWLDITRPSTAQDGLVGPSSVGQIFYYSYWHDDGGSYTYGGAMVASTDSFTDSLVAGAKIDSQLYLVSYSHHFFYDGYNGAAHTDFPQGVPGYMGVRFSDIDGYHYGWIGVVRFGFNHHELHFNAFAWGYETEPAEAEGRLTNSTPATSSGGKGVQQCSVTTIS
jgi:hypothetical protein